MGVTGVMLLMEAGRMRQKMLLPAVTVRLPPAVVDSRWHRPVGPDVRGLAAIRAFEHWMDSLRTDSVGRRTYDSVCRLRPGLLDSARQADAYYSHFH